MNSDFSEPPWLSDLAVDDTAWADAWEATGEPQRARLKGCLAALCEAHAPAATPDSRTFSVERCGIRLSRTERPRPLAACFFTPEASPAQVLAASAPARLLGVERVLAVCLGPIPGPVLCGLELAGVEEAYELSSEQAGGLAAQVAEAGGVALGLGPSEALPPGLHWRADLPASVSVWLKEPDSFDPDIFDLEAIVQAVGPAKVLVWNGPEQLPGSCEAVAGDLQDLLATLPQVVYCQEECGLAAPLRLGPGQEGSWLWPGLDASLFRLRSAALFSA